MQGDAAATDVSSEQGDAAATGAHPRNHVEGEWVVVPLGLPKGLCFVVLLITKLQEKQALVDLVVAAAELLIATEAESEAPTLFHLGQQ